MFELNASIFKFFIGQILVFQEQLRERRVTFLEHLMQRMRVGQTIWYMDETTTNLLERPRRIWQPQGGIRIKLSKQHKHNITIIGALSHGRLSPV